MSAGEQGAPARRLNPTWPGWHWWTGLVALLTLLATATARAAATVAVEIDLRAEIAAGRFDPARDLVGVRGAIHPCPGSAA